jgi:hypothetical protein
MLVIELSELACALCPAGTPGTTPGTGMLPEPQSIETWASKIVRTDAVGRLGLRSRWRSKRWLGEHTRPRVSLAGVSPDKNGDFFKPWAAVFFVTESCAPR